MSEFRDYLVRGKCGHLIGIGGVSMSPLAEVLRGCGLVISGSDISANANVVHLEELGIPVTIGHFPETITENIDFVVRTAAARDDNPEVKEARRKGIPVFERAQAWGAIMRSYDRALCISGTHGKTTTTSMSTHIMMAAHTDPTVMIGGTLPLLKSGHRVGQGNTIIMESCEYYNSFLSFYPTVAVILNIEEDHLDFFTGGIEQIKASFREFASHVPQDGFVVVNRDDANTMEAVKGLDRKFITFGLTDAADVYPKNVVLRGAHSEFDVIRFGKKFAHITLQVPGLHNVKNALAATAACTCLGAGPLDVQYGLAAFTGAGRRFEFKGKYNGADVFDDYAHHPGELKALLDTVETLGYSRTILCFQPHTYSRTLSLYDKFAEQLRRPDIAILGEIYAARETNTQGISSESFTEVVPGSMYFPTFEKMTNALKMMARPGDIILTVGAGDIYRVGDELVK